MVTISNFKKTPKPIPVSMVLAMVGAYAKEEPLISCGRHAKAVLESYDTFNSKLTVCNLPENVIILGDTVCVYVTNGGWAILEEHLCV